MMVAAAATANVIRDVCVEYERKRGECETTMTTTWSSGKKRRETNTQK